MTEENLYQSPSSDLAKPISMNSSELVAFRKQLIPLWIKVFGWLFIVVAVIVLATSAVAIATSTEGYYALYGLETTSQVFSPLALFIISLFIAHGVCAYGLLFAKDWGLVACLLLGYISVAICILSMIFGTGFSIRLELLLLAFYLLKLHKLNKLWFGNQYVE